MSRRIVGRWRALTGSSAVRDPDRPTLVALSGGPDSSALLIALAGVSKARIAAAHIRHNLRPHEFQQRDADAAQTLADKLCIDFHMADITVPEIENAEAAARLIRYSKLTQIAEESGSRYVATGHHAQDQLETLLMALVRGTGLSGLSGIAESRPLSEKVGLIRPGLTTTRQELGLLCSSAGFCPSHDETNDDTTRQRAWLRASVIPELVAHADKDLPERLLSASALVRQANQMIDQKAREIVLAASQNSDSTTIRLDALSNEQPIVIGHVIRLLAARLVGDVGADSRGYKHLQPIIDAIQNRSMHTKKFDLQGLAVEVCNKALQLSAQSAAINSVTSRTSRSTSDGSPEL